MTLSEGPPLPQLWFLIYVRRVSDLHSFNTKSRYNGLAFVSGWVTFVRGCGPPSTMGAQVKLTQAAGLKSQPWLHAETPEDAFQIHRYPGAPQSS